ncbi:MAG: hypothetical protein HYT98_04715 [Candidatus Sungbacteria bacterium]|nr:hypothetical protein [Candidatus Sungbacteria bacterium]
MDIISHGLWGSIAFGRKNKRSFWKAFLFGIAPDFLAFAPLFILIFSGIIERPPIPPVEPPDTSLIPQFVYQIYNVTHSLIIFVAVFGLLWLILRRPVWELGAWGLHILLDIPTHSYKFFPTPFLWPISDFKVNGAGWAEPYVFFPNVILLLILYLWFYFIRPRIKAAK